MRLELLPEFDEKRTAQNVADFLQGKGAFRHHSYPRLLETEQVLGMISGSTGDVTGIHGSPSNHMEEAMIAKAHCRLAIKCVKQSIASCTLTQQIILKERYLNGTKRAVVIGMVNIGGNDQYQLADQAARNRFAAALDKLAVIEGVDDLIPQLQA